jgi:hypothetical protein
MTNPNPTRNEILDAIYQAQDGFRETAEELNRLAAKIRQLTDLQVQRNTAFAGGSAQAALKAAAMALGEDAAPDDERPEVPDDHSLALQGLNARQQQTKNMQTHYRQEHYALLLKLADSDALEAQLQYRAATKDYINALAKLSALDDSFSRNGIKRYCGIAGTALTSATIPMDAEETRTETAKGRYATSKSIAYLLDGPRRAAAQTWEKDLDSAGVLLQLKG